MSTPDSTERIFQLCDNIKKTAVEHERQKTEDTRRRMLKAQNRLINYLNTVDVHPTFSRPRMVPAVSGGRLSTAFLMSCLSAVHWLYGWTEKPQEPLLNMALAFSITWMLAMLITVRPKKMYMSNVGSPDDQPTDRTGLTTIVK
jgi:hypothetical protein